MLSLTHPKLITSYVFTCMSCSNVCQHASALPDKGTQNWNPVTRHIAGYKTVSYNNMTDFFVIALAYMQQMVANKHDFQGYLG